jgi:hypothetical protein
VTRATKFEQPQPRSRPSSLSLTFSPQIDKQSSNLKNQDQIAIHPPTPHAVTLLPPLLSSSSHWFNTLVQAFSLLAVNQLPPGSSTATPRISPPLRRSAHQTRWLSQRPLCLSIVSNPDERLIHSQLSQQSCDSRNLITTIHLLPPSTASAT